MTETVMLCFIFSKIDERVSCQGHCGRGAFAFIGMNNNIRTVQAESSKFASLLFDQGFQIVIPPRSPASVPEPYRNAI